MLGNIKGVAMLSGIVLLAALIAGLVAGLADDPDYGWSYALGLVGIGLAVLSLNDRE